MNPAEIRKDFPILERQVHEKQLVYLDSAATSQKPQAVLDALDAYYEKHNANVHRGVHQLAAEATEAYEGARGKVAKFIGADVSQIVFTKNATEAINLVARSWGTANLEPGDEVLLTVMEHHSNLVPWQQLAEAKGLVLKHVGITEDYELDMDSFAKELTSKTKLVAITHMSNTLGCIVPLREVVQAAHAVGAKVMVDGAQSVPHLPINVKDLDLDFLAFSSHKMVGPTGIGVLYGKKELLEAMPPFLGGGEMIAQVGLSKSTYAPVPHKFEAGTPPIAEAIGLGAAVDYLSALGMENVAALEASLAEKAIVALEKIPGLKIVGPRKNRGGAISFVIEGIHPHDISTILDREGVAIRAGHHCTMPLHDLLGIAASTRASFYIYNTEEDIDRLVTGLLKAREVFGLAKSSG
ncbi:MAG: cysteine desulfurase [Candidatus Eisenbacteria bacterium]|uniref:Cysteine desulfurase n=1 Tax=Eiseniibacteriota bacterium TaxID=2212470 RepID=A0A7Y2EA93_UNCEI|nr:cysteine desulfurase [Candidatus Eisenbacteria bacterium]